MFQQRADPSGGDVGGWVEMRRNVVDDAAACASSLSTSLGLRCPFSSPPYTASALIDEPPIPLTPFGSFPAILTPSSSPSTCNCIVKEGYVGEYLVRLALNATSESSGYPTLQLEISQGSCHILSHSISLQPSKKVANAEDAPIQLNESNGHPGNKKRKRPEEQDTKTSSTTPDPAFLSQAVSFSNPMRQLSKRQKCERVEHDLEEKGCQDPGARDETILASQHHHDQSSLDNETGSSIGILSLPAELLQHIFLRVPLLQMARLNEVCKQWQSVIDDEPLWRHVFSRNFGIPLYFRLSWKQRALSCYRRSQIFELDLDGSLYGQLSWAAQFGYYQYFRNTVSQYSDTQSPLKYKIDGDLVRFAATEGFCDIIDSIRSAHDITKLRDNMRRTGLHHAAKFGNMEVVKLFLSHDPTLVEDKDKYGDTPLILASCYGNTAVVKFLLANNAQVEGKNQDDYTPLIFAAQNGHTEIVDVLLNAGANPNSRGNEGTTPLLIAAQEGHLDVIKLLLKHKPDLDNQVVATGDTALILAVCYGHEAVVEILLSAGANPNLQTAHGKSAVFFAASQGRFKMLKQLVSAGGIVTTQTVERVTPLMGAIKGGHREIAEYLLAQGATVDPVDTSGNTALLLAVWQEDSQMVRMLLPHVLEVQRKQKALKKGKGEKQCGQIKVKKGKHPRLRIKQCKPKRKRKEGKEKGKEKEDMSEYEEEDEEMCERAFIMVDEEEEEEETEEVKEKEEKVSEPLGLTIDLTDEVPTITTATTLPTATPSEIEGANNLLDFKDKAGCSALMLAVKKKNTPLMKLLLENGADALSTVDSQGRNAVGLARELGMEEVLEPFLSPEEQHLLHQRELAEESRRQETLDLLRLLPPMPSSPMQQLPQGSRETTALPPPPRPPSPGGF